MASIEFDRRKLGVAMRLGKRYAEKLIQSWAIDPTSYLFPPDGIRPPGPEHKGDASNRSQVSAIRVRHLNLTHVPACRCGHAFS